MKRLEEAIVEQEDNTVDIYYDSKSCAYAVQGYKERHGNLADACTAADKAKRNIEALDARLKGDAISLRAAMRNLYPYQDSSY